MTFSQSFRNSNFRGHANEIAAAASIDQERFDVILCKRCAIAVAARDDGISTIGELDADRIALPLCPSAGKQAVHEGRRAAEHHAGFQRFQPGKARCEVLGLFPANAWGFPLFAGGILILVEGARSPGTISSCHHISYRERVLN